MIKLITLWQFARPHTIVGSTLSILSLFFIALGTVNTPLVAGLLLPLSLLAALACNVYITGLNQWSDVEVDQINKPWLPIPSGKLQKKGAMRIVLVCGLIALIAAACLSAFFFFLIFLIMGIGTAYSLPPLKFKRRHTLAAGAITVVRGLLVNLGFYLHFRHEMTGEWRLSEEIWPITVFVTAFSLGIAWFKDIPDTQGDDQYQFGTLAVLSGRRFAFRAGLLVVSLAYLSVMLAAILGQLPVPWFYILTQAFFLMAFLNRARRLDLQDNVQVKGFYMFFWGLFFLEYLIYPVGFFV